MKLLLTGAAGQVGLEVQRQARSIADLHVIATDLPELDITDLESVQEFIVRHQPDLIVNAAAYTAVDAAEDNEHAARQINEGGPRNLALCCAEQRIPLLHISTDYVYPGNKTTGYVESDTPGPVSAYGRTKLAGDQAVARILGDVTTDCFKPAFLILRTAWVYSEHGGNFVKTMVRLARERDQLQVVADQVGNPTSAADIAAALLMMTRRLMRGEPMTGGVYHFTGMGTVSWHGFASAIVEQAAGHGLIERIPGVRPITTADYPTRAIRPANSALNCAAFDRMFPEFVRPAWEESLAGVLAQLTRSRF